MDRLVVLGGKLVGRIHRRMWRRFQDQKLTGAEQENLTGRAGLVRRQRLLHEFAQHRIQRAQMAQGLAGQRPRETGIAGGKPRKLIPAWFQQQAFCRTPERIVSAALRAGNPCSRFRVSIIASL